MKYVLIVISTVLLIACSKPQKTPYLVLKPDKPMTGVVELYSLANGNQVFDRAIEVPDKGQLVFIKDSVPEGIYELRVGTEPIATIIISSPFPTSISGSFQSNDIQLSINGNAETKALWKCEYLAAQANDQIAQTVANLPDSLVKDQFLVHRDSLYNAINKIITDKANEINRISNNHRSSLLPLLIMQLKAGNHLIFNPGEYADLYYEVSNQLQNSYPNYPPVKLFARQVDTLMEHNLFNAITKEGRTLPSVSIPDAWNQEVLIDNLVDKPTLFVLWKSQDEASRAITKQLMRMTRSFRNQGLQICMISFDTDRESWLKAIKEDRLAVLHLSDLKGDASPVLQQLGLTSVPYMLLVDQNKIVVKRSREIEELTASLRQLMKN